MTSTSSKDFTYAMGPMKILSWPVGTWPLQKYDFFSGMRCVVSVVLLLLTLVVINTELYLDSSDSEKNLDAVVLVTCSILSIWKLVMFRVRSEGLVANFTSAVRDYNEHEGDEKRAIMRHHAYMGRVACGCVIFFSYFGSTVFTAAPMLADEEEEEEFLNATQDTVMDYPMPSEALLNMLDPPASLYPLIYVGEYLLLLMISTGNLGSDSLFFGIIFHLCGQAEVLKLDFSKFVGDTVESTSARFNVLVARHQHLLQLSRHLNKTISLVMVMQLFTSCLLICTTGFQFILSLSEDNIVMVVKTFIVVITLLTQLFAYSYIGEYMKNQFEDVGYWTYCSDWYTVPRKVSLNTVFVLMRTQDPVQLKAADFFVVNMETYMSIVKTSVSYLSVLRAMVNS